MPGWNDHFDLSRFLLLMLLLHTMCMLGMERVYVRWKCCLLMISIPDAIGKILLPCALQGISHVAKRAFVSLIP